MSTNSKQSVDLQEAYIWRVYNTPELHGSYCPCGGCEQILGPLPEWIHEIGRRDDLRTALATQPTEHEEHQP